MHIPKCGGTAIENALLMEENVKFDRALFNSPKGCYSLPNSVKCEYKLGIHGRQHCFLSYHPVVYQKNYLSFTFVRNPWDLMVSKYYYSHLPREGISFKKMILSMDDVDAKLRPRHRLKFNQSDFINPNMSYIGRFENLQEDFDFICEKIGIPRQQLEKLNTTNHPPYWECYDTQTREIVATRYKKDIEAFEYKWEPMLGF